MNRNTKSNRLHAAIVNLFNLMMQMIRQFFTDSANAIKNAYGRIQNSNVLNTTTKVLSIIGLVLASIVLLVLFGSVMFVLIAAMFVTLMILCVLVALRILIKFAILVALFITFAVFLNNNLTDTVIEEIPAIVDVQKMVNNRANIVCEGTVYYVEAGENVWNEFWSSETMTNPEAERNFFEILMYNSKENIEKICDRVFHDDEVISTETEPARRPKEVDTHREKEDGRIRRDNITSPIGG